MSNNMQNIAELIVKHLNEELSDEEHVALQAWLSESEKNRLFFNKVISEKRIKEGIIQFQKTNEVAIWEKIAKELPDKTRRIGFRHSWINYAAAAAIVLFISTATFFLIYPDQKDAIQTNLAGVNYKNDIAPGGNKAILTLADGSTIILDSAQNGALAQQGSTRILKLNNGQLAYNLTNKLLSNTKVLYNTISTPKGGQYQIVLPDGSKVWLNAASSIKFPTAFIGKERRVEISGEAYFEVATRQLTKGNSVKMPFIVSVNGMEVKVLGTHFNISAYDDESMIKTTLLEGSVQVLSLISHQSSQIEPGQQSSLDAQGKISITKANLNEAVAWKNGRFLFVNSNLKDIMCSLSRWYDVSVIYQDPKLQQLKFTMDIKKYENFGKVKEIMELTENISFEITGKQVLIKRASR